MAFVYLFMSSFICPFNFFFQFFQFIYCKCHILITYYQVALFPYSVETSSAAISNHLFLLYLDK